MAGHVSQLIESGDRRWPGILKEYRDGKDKFNTNCIDWSDDTSTCELLPGTHFTKSGEVTSGLKATIESVPDISTTAPSPKPNHLPITNSSENEDLALQTVQPTHVATTSMPTLNPTWPKDCTDELSGPVLGGVDVVEYRSLPPGAKAILGNRAHARDFHGYTFWFVSNANAKTFVFNPEYYAPAWYVISCPLASLAADYLTINLN
jgi:YHS domain-containing protein